MAPKKPAAPKSVSETPAPAEPPESESDGGPAQDSSSGNGEATASTKATSAAAKSGSATTKSTGATSKTAGTTSKSAGTTSKSAAGGKPGTATTGAKQSDLSRRGVSQVNRAPSSQRPASSQKSGTKPATGRPAGAAAGGSSKARARQAASPVRVQQRRFSPAMLGWIGGALVVVIVLVIVLVSLTSSSPPPSSSPDGTPVPQAVITATTSVPLSVINQVGTGGNPASSSTGNNPVNPIKTSKPSPPNGLPPVDGKPVVFYFGALWCPYCATERWSIVVALSHFGTFSNLKGAVSFPTDIYPNTQTWSFYGSSYTSKYLTFEPVEVEDENKAPLQNLDAAQTKILSTWNPGGSFPFLTIGTKYIAGLPAWVSPQLLQGLTRAQIAETLYQPSNLAGSALIANANYLTAAICKVTGQQPASVCGSPGITAVTKQLPHLPAAQVIPASA